MSPTYNIWDKAFDDDDETTKPTQVPVYLSAS